MEKLTYLDTYVLQQDMRIRLPKAVLTNLGVEKGVSKFDVFFNSQSKELILKIHMENEEKNKECVLLAAKHNY